MKKDYGGIIWTNHAIQRMQDRGIKQGDAWATWKRPDNSHYTKSKGAWIYHRTYGNERIEVVAKQNEKKQWIVLSVWSKRLRKQHRKASKEKIGIWDLLKGLFKVSKV